MMAHNCSHIVPDNFACPSTVNTYIIQSHTLKNVDSSLLSKITFILTALNIASNSGNLFINSIKKYC
jgi:hypothetical protein